MAVTGVFVFKDSSDQSIWPYGTCFVNDRAKSNLDVPFLGEYSSVSVIVNID